MKFLFAVLIAAGLVLARPAAAVVISGQNYVSMADWAHANGFGGYTRDRGMEVVMTNRTSRLVFDVNSAVAEINGVEVRLSYPIANTKNGPCIAALDIDKSLRSLLLAQKPSGRRIRTILPASGAWRQ